MIVSSQASGHPSKSDNRWSRMSFPNNVKQVKSYILQVNGPWAVVNS